MNRPYILDLQSSNGTFINGIKIPNKRYVELKTTDTIKFGESTRDYVFMNEDDAE